VRFVQSGLTRENYREILSPLLTEGGGQGFCVNVSVDTSSVDIMELCRELGALYIDTVNEPWAGFYFDASKGPEARTNFALREATLSPGAKNPGGPTAVTSSAPLCHCFVFLNHSLILILSPVSRYYSSLLLFISLQNIPYFF
jgi:homospermidine synthase